MLAGEAGWYPCWHVAVQWASTQGRLAPGWWLQMADLLGKGAGMHSVHMMAGMQAPQRILYSMPQPRHTRSGCRHSVSAALPACAWSVVHAGGALLVCGCLGAACCRVLTRHRGESCMAARWWSTGVVGCRWAGPVEDAACPLWSVGTMLPIGTLQSHGLLRWACMLHHQHTVWLKVLGLGVASKGHGAHAGKRQVGVCHTSRVGGTPLMLLEGWWYDVHLAT